MTFEIHSMERNSLVFIILTLIGTIYSEDNNELVLIPSEQETVEEDKSTNTEHYDSFHATNEWQTLKENQAIPRGLHVQINLQTGEKRAKLMEEDERKQKQSLSSKQKFIKIDRNMISKQKLKDALKDFKDKFYDERAENDVIASHEKNKYRSMDEIKQEFNGANIWMKKDIEIMTYQVAILNKSDSSKTEILHALEELEYLVHQIDNARDLVMIGGLEIVVNFLNTTDNDVQSAAAYVIGSAAQSNLPVQVSLLGFAALPLLTRSLVNSRNSLSLRKKSIFAISSILRLCPKATQKFLKIGGLSHLSSLFEDNSSDVLQMKSLTLLVDLLTEQMEKIREKAKQVGIEDYEKAVIKAPLLKAMYEEGWCKLSLKLITTSDTEKKEKLLEAFHVLLPACWKEWKLNSQLKETLASWRKQWKHEIQMEEEDDTGYLDTLVKLVDSIDVKCGW